MAGELVERLRKLARNHERGFPQAFFYTQLHQEAELAAADRIEALERENATLRAERDEARKALEPIARLVGRFSFLSDGDTATIGLSAYDIRRAAAIRNMGGGENG